MAIHEGELMKYNPGTNQLVKIDIPEANHTFVRNVACLTMNYGWELTKVCLL